MRPDHPRPNDTNHDIFGGRENIVTFGVNWYLNTNLRVMVDSALVNNDKYANSNGDAIGGDRFGFLQARCQVTF